MFQSIPRDDAEKLLRAGELPVVFPEGFKGCGKPYKHRYQLQRFGRGGFATVAVRTGAPIIPCAIIGSEELIPCSSTSPRWRSSSACPTSP